VQNLVRHTATVTKWIVTATDLIVDIELAAFAAIQLSSGSGAFAIPAA
jgi:hypothetical protein